MDVPAVPVRKLLIGGAVAVVVIAAATAIVAPRISDRKARQAAEAAREHDQLIQQRRLRAIAEQRPRSLRAADLKPAAGATDAQKVAARVALVDAAANAITADAKRRVKTGEMRGNPSATTCSPYPPREVDPRQDLKAHRGVYDCLTTIRTIAATSTNGGGQLGYPFRAVVDFDAFSFVWCKTNPVPGERVVPDPRTVVELPKACRAA